MAVDQVIRILEELADAYEKLIETARLKKAAIIANDTDSLSRIASIESKSVARIVELDRDRQEWSAKVLTDKGLNLSEGVTLSRVYRAVFNPDQRNRLRQAEYQLRGCLEELKKLNDLNQLLLKQSIEFVQYSIELLTPQPDDSYIYRNPASQARDYMRTGFYNKKV